ncbi:MAG: hypothetical protein JWM03_1890, partial [Rhodocyclales bacterium]|nr:hypothetical protein [Rhodocyclales bacterium]
MNIFQSIYLRFSSAYDKFMSRTEQMASYAEDDFEADAN